MGVADLSVTFGLLRGSVLSTTVMLLCGVTPAAAWQDSLTIRPLRGGVVVLHGHPGGNILVVPTPGAVVLVDAQSASVSSQVHTAIDRVADRDVGLVINTHYHEDHIGGNSEFRRVGAVVLGHSRLAAQAVIDTTITELDWHREPAHPDDLPSVTVARDSLLVVHGTRIEVLAFESAHTDGDLAVYLPHTNVLHTGDIVEVDAFPFIDWWGGGSLGGTIAAVDRLLALADSETQIVPGHGRVVDRAHLVRYRRMLVEVSEGVRGAIRHGLDLDATIQLGLATEWADERGGEAAGGRFVGILYLGLSRGGS